MTEIKFPKEQEEYDEDPIVKYNRKIRMEEIMIKGLEANPLPDAKENKKVIEEAKSRIVLYKQQLERLER